MCFCAIMNNTTKNQQACDVICKKSNRLQTHERDLYRVCPSKLSKRELENLYFALLENNIELKKTLHSQQDKLKVLSTKLQRMTVVQRNAAGKEKDCCNSKVLVKEQKDIITDLKTANEKMSDRLRLLNMRLCSAKQFLKRSPSQSSKCPRCGVCTVTTKNASMSAIETKPSLTSNKVTASCQYIPNGASENLKSTQEVETQTTDLEYNVGTEKQCNKNKCKTVMDELKQKIVNLQEELSKTHGEYSKRISKLESDVSTLHQENTRVKSSRAVSEHALQQREQKTVDLKGQLREAEGKINDMKMQLTIEKRKVKELETTLRLAKTSDQVVKAMASINIPKSTQKPKPASETVASESVSSYYSVKQDVSRASSPEPCICKVDDKKKLLPSTATSEKSKEEGKLSKSDDSGCTDLNNSSDADDSKASYMERLNQEMLQKISDLQIQLDGFRIKNAGQSSQPVIPKSSDLDSFDYDEEEMQMTIITITDPNVVLEIQEFGVESTYSKPEKDIDTSTPMKESYKTNIARLIKDSENADMSRIVKGSENANMSEIVKDSENAGMSRIVKDSENANMSRIVKDSENANMSKIAKDSENANMSEIVKDSENANTSNKDSTNNNSWDDLVKLKGRDSNKTEESGSSSQQPSKFDEPNVSELKRNEDNKYQIPGPIPTTYQTYKEKKKPLKNKSIKINKTDEGLDDLVHKNKSYECVKVTGSFDNANKTGNESGEKEVIDDLKSDAIKYVKTNKSATKHVDSSKTQIQKIKIIDPKDEEIASSSLHHIFRDPLASNNTVPTKEKKSADEVKKALTIAKPDGASTDDLSEVKRESSSSYGYRSNTIVTPQSIDNHIPEKNLTRSQVPKTGNDITPRTNDFVIGVPVEEAQSTKPTAVLKATVPQTMPQSGVTVSHDSATYTATSAPKDCGTYTVTPALRDLGTLTKPGDLEDCKCGKCERATSPANTELDVSCLSDLPPEKDGKSPRSTPPTSPRDTRSPGEEKATSTSTDTETRTYDCGPLSDGELPMPATLVKPRKLSFDNNATYTRPQFSSEAQMEATLNAISEELAHCRKLLAAARDHEGPYTSTICGNYTTCGNNSVGGNSSVGGNDSVGGNSVVDVPCGSGIGRERAHRLHATAASRRLPDTATHTAIFTFHIGTLVLSDEAVFCSRDKSLILTWQFYDQAVAMTRMRAGRVVLFDFSTEYDVVFNENFLNYMKQEEMPLTVCDINKQDEPFATCSLPLRDAFINTNRRADMSLALMAGPAFCTWSNARSGRSVDPLVAGDELGVLDLWCCLRAPPSLQHLYSDNMARSPMIDPSNDNNQTLVHNNSRMDLQSADEDPENRMSQEILIGSRVPRRFKAFQALKSGSDRPATLGRDWSFNHHPSNTPTLEMGARNSDIPDVIARHDQSPSKYSVQTQKYLQTSDQQPGDENWSDGRLTSSVLFANEVPANIKSTAEMKQALERNVQRIPKPDEEFSQAHSSLLSLRNAAEKQRMQRMISTKQSRASDGLQNMLKEERKMSMLAAAAAAKESYARKKRVPFSVNSQDIEPDIQSRYDNIGQFVGLNKILEQSKKTVTYTDSTTKSKDAQSLKQESSDDNQADQSMDITILWLALNEECEAMVNPQVRRLYVAYSFLGRRGAELETPISLPKPKHYAEKCYFNFKKTFNLHDADLPLLGHMSRCRAGRSAANPRDCLVFSVVSEPPEDPLGISSCQDIGHAYLYLGDILAYSAGGAGYTEVVPVRAARTPGRGAGVTGAVCGVLAVRVDGLQVLRGCLTLSHSSRDLAQIPSL